MIDRLLIDNSAWARLNDRRIPSARVEEVAAAVEARQLYVCVPFLLEAGYSARSSADHEVLLSNLLALPWAALNDAAEHSALVTQRQLARIGHHRMPPIDILIAAVAHTHGLGVLHYDKDFDVIAASTTLAFRSEWLVTAGSI